MYNQDPIEVPMYIGNQYIVTDGKHAMSIPTNTAKVSAISVMAIPAMFK